MKKSTSPYITVKSSSIHNKGVFAKKDIPQGTKIIEYIGKKITKRESEKIADLQIESNKKNSSHGAVYIFELNKRYDIDGNFDYNTAKYINHSCEPNCEARNLNGHIWITALKDIKKGTEIAYNYGYAYDSAYTDHLCYCNSTNCIGYILDKNDWKKLKKSTFKAKKLSKKSKKNENIAYTATP